MTWILTIPFTPQTPAEVQCPKMYGLPNVSSDPTEPPSYLVLAHVDPQLLQLLTGSP